MAIYSFKGSGYVRGGIFDRIELEQGGSGTRFRDRNHERLGALEAEGAPTLRDIGLFTVPDDFTLDPTEPWEIELLVQRATGAREKAFLRFELPYSLPDRYIRHERKAPRSLRKMQPAAGRCRQLQHLQTRGPRGRGLGR